ncbi:hypothetical protein BDV29DRAFT_178164 [Aspergillus leporis]|uniref:Uncharacterized protein n=1 Tax=Aspergillus leporis TaxID=41062 RepID=A0A5N5WY70_9EURO|nr:hypothetical protein BDV29DRAFT_178164 [Aspergillus leporis]
MRMCRFQLLLWLLIFPIANTNGHTVVQLTFAHVRGKFWYGTVIQYIPQVQWGVIDWL